MKIHELKTDKEMFCLTLGKIKSYELRYDDRKYKLNDKGEGSMVLKEYKKHIDKLVKDGHGNKECFYAIDDEGNGYNPVHYSPSIASVKELNIWKEDLIKDTARKIIVIN